MIEWAWPILFAAAPLPWLLRWWLPAQIQVDEAALRVPFLADFGAGSLQSSRLPQKWPLWLASVAWLCLVMAAARPQWLGEPIEQTVSGRDLMLAVDVSGSMEEKDFFINDKAYDRLTAIKYVVSDFVIRRVGDRLGLILFGTHAYLHVPLTFDRKTVETLLNEAFIGITDDEPQTSIGDAIGLAVKRLQDQKSNNRVLILLTDGANTAGELTPLQAAEIAAQQQLKIYTIGVGADEIQIRGLFGTRRVRPSTDLDEGTLKKIAELTGGRYFRARNTEELAEIYRLLDELEPVEKDKQYFRPMHELFYWPLSAALCICAFLSLTRSRWT